MRCNKRRADRFNRGRSMNRPSGPDDLSPATGAPASPLLACWGVSDLSLGPRCEKEKSREGRLIQIKKFNACHSEERKRVPVFSKARATRRGICLAAALVLKNCV